MQITVWFALHIPCIINDVCSCISIPLWLLYLSPLRSRLELPVGQSVWPNTTSSWGGNFYFYFYLCISIYVWTFIALVLLFVCLSLLFPSFFTCCCHISHSSACSTIPLHFSSWPPLPLRIEEELGDQARYAGHNFRNPSAIWAPVLEAVTHKKAECIYAMLYFPWQAITQ